MNIHRFQNDLLPTELYRVHYVGSQTTFSSDEGLVAADTTKIYNDGVSLGRAVVNHFTWGSRESSPFISLFSDREHAESWALKEPWRGASRDAQEGDWALLVIETQLLEEAWLGKVSQLVSVLKLRIPDRAAQHIRGSFLCLHKIPAAAIVQWKDSGQVQAGM
ncbi:hypothetical protein FDECE_17037 [Fusarium decemcellulare]|nr:hypothetical protein FDECE_17037 [Fusarium decemcellulare]